MAKLKMGPLLQNPGQESLVSFSATSYVPRLGSCMERVGLVERVGGSRVRIGGAIAK